MKNSEKSKINNPESLFFSEIRKRRNCKKTTAIQVDVAVV